ncbi:FoF1 ATP synthase subunit a [Anaerolineales bacterium HSG6]|nr:FoF1 ATP synthase subunit a [Anaerolineales bacterium HSG6]MDM8530311.1 FoF1 ATP synthase subunit a [Anaerolineales bacterium HSG25]
MDKLKSALPYLAGAILLMALSVLFLRDEQPVISVSAEHLFWVGPLNVTNSLFTSWVVIVIILVFVGVGLRNMSEQPSGLQNALEFLYEGLYNLTENVAGPEHVKRFFAIPATIFIYVLVSNWFALFPGFPLLGVGLCTEAHHAEETAHAEDSHADEGHAEEASGSMWTTCAPGEHVVPLFRSPSADLNNTLSLALVTQVMSWTFGIMVLGFAGYFSKFFVTKKMISGATIGERFLGVIDFLVGLLELLSEFVKIVAYTFRLFGNIFAGEVTVMILTFFVPLILTLPMLGFEIFVGFIQAFVFFILSVAFYTLAVASHGDEAH